MDPRQHQALRLNTESGEIKDGTEGGRGEEEGERGVGRGETQRRKSLFDWPVAFTKVKLMAANCALAKCSEERVNHNKWQSRVHRELSQCVNEYTQTRSAQT